MKEDIKKISESSHLILTEEQLDKFTNQISSILDSFKELDELDTKEIEPSFHPTIRKNIFIKDKIEKGLSIEEAFANTEHKENNFFKGPRAV